MQQEQSIPIYTTRRAAVAGAKRALEKLGVQSPMSEVHFVINSAFTDEATPGPFTWVRMDLQTGLPVGEAPPPPVEKPQEPVVEVPAAKAPAQEQAPQRVSTPALTERAPRWAAPKDEPAGAKAYKPKPGTSQAVIYALLTNPAGTDIEWFCQEMNRTIKAGTAPWTPSNTWSGVRYLFCALRGYGLRFDGRRLFLVVPSVEVDGKPGS